MSLRVMSVLVLAPVLVISVVLRGVAPRAGAVLAALGARPLPRQGRLPKLRAVVPGHAALPHVGVLGRHRAVVIGSTAGAGTGPGRASLRVPGGVLLHVGAAPAVGAEQRLSDRVEVLQLLVGISSNIRAVVVGNEFFTDVFRRNIVSRFHKKSDIIPLLVGEEKYPQIQKHNNTAIAVNRQ